MDVKMISKRYSTPTIIKIIGTLLFPAAVIIMMLLPVFELIPQDAYVKVFNIAGVATGSYESTQYTIFTMLANDYGSGLAMGIFVTQCILAAICGIALLWVNRPKIATAPAAVLLWTVIFSVFRSPAKLFTGAEYWTYANKEGLASVENANSASGFVTQYSIDGKDYIFNTLGQYWVLWCLGILVLALTIAGIIVTKTLIEKKK